MVKMSDFLNVNFKLKYVLIGWYPELLFQTVVFFNSTDLAIVIPNSTVIRNLFYTTTS